MLTILQDRSRYARRAGTALYRVRLLLRHVALRTCRRHVRPVHVQRRRYRALPGSVVERRAAYMRERRAARGKSYRRQRLLRPAECVAAGSCSLPIIAFLL